MTEETLKPGTVLTPAEFRQAWSDAVAEAGATLKPEADWTPEGRRALGEALVKTGTEHLNLDMVRQGKQALKEAEAASAPATPPKT